VAGASETELLAALRRLPHFAELTPELLSLVAARARRRTASRGDVLCRAGEPGEEFFLVIGGAVRIAVPSARGEEVVAELGTGEWFGEMALITGEPRSASGIAATDTVLAVLARADFLELVTQVPAAWRSATRSATACVLVCRAARRGPLRASCSPSRRLRTFGTRRCWQTWPPRWRARAIGRSPSSTTRAGHP